MTTEYHRKVVESLIELGDDWKTHKRIRKVHRGSELPLSIVDPRSKLVLNYQPDAYFILRNNKKLIFEVLDSEREKQDSIVADIICSFLVENVDGLIFIHPGPESVENTVLEALKTIYKALINKGVHASELPNPKKTGPRMISKTESKDDQKMRDKLNQYASKDGW